MGSSCTSPGGEVGPGTEEGEGEGRRDREGRRTDWMGEREGQEEDGEDRILITGNTLMEEDYPSRCTWLIDVHACANLYSHVVQCTYCHSE